MRGYTSVRADAVWHQAVVGEDGMSMVVPAISDSKSTEDGKANKLCAVRRVGGGVDLTRISSDCPLPLGRYSQKDARPNVYMFGDGRMNWNRVSEQEKNFIDWYALCLVI